MGLGQEGRLQRQPSSDPNLWGEVVGKSFPFLILKMGTTSPSHGDIRRPK